MSRQVWVVSELYYPEETSTGYLLTKIAEGLATRHPVKVICAQPTYSRRGVLAPRHEMRNGVEIFRVPSTRFNRQNLLLRLINLFTISLTTLFKGMLSFRRDDVVFVVTNPPLLPFVTTLAAKFRSARMVLVVHDVYPDVLVATNVISPNGVTKRFLELAEQWLLRNMTAVVTLGVDMQRIIRRKVPEMNERVKIIRNWADLEFMLPLPKRETNLLKDLKLLDKFIIQYSGNMGRTHGLENIFETMKLLRSNKDLHFLFLGDGAKRGRLQRLCAVERLDSVTFVDPRPRSEQPDFLNACDVMLISFLPGMSGISVPSRMYNVLAAGRPIIAVCDPDSELAKVVMEHDVGWVVEPESPQQLAEVISYASANPVEVAAMGMKARTAAEKHFAFKHAVDSYQELLQLTAA